MNIRTIAKIHRERRWCALPEAKPLLDMPKWLIAEALIHKCAVSQDSYKKALKNGTAIEQAITETKILKRIPK